MGAQISVDRLLLVETPPEAEREEDCLGLSPPPLLHVDGPRPQGRRDRPVPRKGAYSEQGRAGGEAGERLGKPRPVPGQRAGPG